MIVIVSNSDILFCNTKIIHKYVYYIILSMKCVTHIVSTQGYHASIYYFNLFIINIHILYLHIMII